MATGGGGEPVSLSSGSEEVVESPCLICLKDDRTVRGVQFCIQCAGHLCTACLDMHGKFPATSGHQVVDAGQGEGQGAVGVSQTPTGQMTNQDSDFLDSLFNSYNEAGSDLRSINRSSFEMWSPPVTWFRNTEQLLESQIKVTTLREQLAQIKAMKQDQMNNIESLEHNDINAVDALRVKLITRINDLADAERDKIKEKYIHEKCSVTTDMLEINEHIKVVDENYKSLDDAVNDVGQPHAVDLRVIEKKVTEGTTLYQRLWQTLDKTFPKYQLETEIESALQAIGHLGDFATNAELQGEIDVRLVDDLSVCDVNGSCLMADGTLVLVDADNNRLKHICLEDQHTTCCEFEDEPCAVCSISYSEVAVTVTNKKKVQIVSLRGTPVKSRSFSVSQFCRGICHYDGELFVACGDNIDPESAFVGVHAKSGTLLRKIEKDETGRRVFEAPFHIAVDSEGNVHVADAENGVITMDKYGRNFSVFNESCIERPFGICAVSKDSLIVSGMDSHNVIQIRGHGSKKWSLLLEKSADIYCPLSLLYDCSKSLLIVTFQQSDSVKIYKLS